MNDAGWDAMCEHPKKKVTLKVTSQYMTDFAALLDAYRRVVRSVLLWEDNKFPITLGKARQDEAETKAALLRYVAERAERIDDLLGAKVMIHDTVDAALRSRPALTADEREAVEQLRAIVKAWKAPCWESLLLGVIDRLSGGPE